MKENLKMLIRSILGSDVIIAPSLTEREKETRPGEHYKPRRAVTRELAIARMAGEKSLPEVIFVGKALEYCTRELQKGGGYIIFATQMPDGDFLVTCPQNWTTPETEDKKI